MNEIYCISELDDFMEKEYNYSQGIIDTKLLAEREVIDCINSQVKESDILYILGDVNTISYLPFRLKCKANIIIERESAEDFYKAKWVYLQQGYNEVYRNKVYIKDSILSLRRVQPNKLNRINVLGILDVKEEKIGLESCSMLKRRTRIYTFDYYRSLNNLEKAN